MGKIKKCKVKGCDRKSTGLNLCNMHYLRLKLTGEIGAAYSKMPTREKQCTHPGCTNPARKGHCYEHAPKKKCIVDGCEKFGFQRNRLCYTHFERKAKYGSFELPHFQHKVIPVDENSSSIRGFIFDNDWAEMLRHLPFSSNGIYARHTYKCKETGKAKFIYIHNIIMGQEPNKKTTVDHVDIDPKNNRVSNLRVVTKGENVLNMRRDPERCAKRVVRRSGTRWSSVVTINRKSSYLGVFAKREDAVKRARDFLLEINQKIKGQDCTQKIKEKQTQKS